MLAPATTQISDAKADAVAWLHLRDAMGMVVAPHSTRTLRMSQAAWEPIKLYAWRGVASSSTSKVRAVSSC